MMYRDDPTRGSKRLAQYAVNIVGKTFTIIQTPDIQPGDILLDLQCQHIGYEVPARVEKVMRVGQTDFYDIVWEGEKRKTLPRYAYSCLFGRLKPEE